MGLRIAFFTDSFGKVDGVSRTLALIKKALEKRGHEVYVIAPADGNKLEIRGTEVYLPSLPLLQYKEYRVAIPLRKEIESLGKFDVVHNHGISFLALQSLSLARKYGVPSVASFHTDVASAAKYHVSLFNGEKQVELVWKFLKWLYSQFDLVTAPTEYARKQLLSHDIEAGILRHAADVSRFKEVKSSPFDFDNFLFVGRVSKEKELERAFWDIKMSGFRGKFIIGGKGPFLEYYKELAMELGVDAEFLGYVPDLLLPYLYSSSHAFLFTSSFDTLGLVALESLASGTAVVSPPDVAVSEFTEKLGTVYHTPEELIEVYERAKRLKKRRNYLYSLTLPFSPDKVAKEWEKTYESLI